VAITIEEVTDRLRLGALEPAWTELIAQVPAAEPFSTPEWIGAWLESFWQDRPIRFLFAWDDGKLAGVAPFLVDEQGTFCCRAALALPTDVIAWRGEILHAGDGSAVIGAMLGHLSDAGGWHLTLPRVAADSDTARSLPNIVKTAGLWANWRDENRTPIIRLASSVDEYLQTRSRHVRHELRRKQKRLEKAGEVSVRIVDRLDELDRAFDDVKNVEAKSWKGAAGTSFLDAPSAERFYRTLFARTAAENWARIYLMYVDGNPVAHLFGLVFRQRYYALNSSFDSSLASYSPGSVLILRSIEDACARKFEIFDFMGSEYRWKNEMATEMREHLKVCVFSQLVSRCGMNWTLDQHVKPGVRKHLPTALKLKKALAQAGASQGAPRPQDGGSTKDEDEP
jgi:CelD/BcsL family acetyltransferase involved in cellulose biosynthesis